MVYLHLLYQQEVIMQSTEGVLFLIASLITKTVVECYPFKQDLIEKALDRSENGLEIAETCLRLGKRIEKYLTITFFQQAAIQNGNYPVIT